MQAAVLYYAAMLALMIASFQTQLPMACASEVGLSKFQSLEQRAPATTSLDHYGHYAEADNVRSASPIRSNMRNLQKRGPVKKELKRLWRVIKRTVKVVVAITVGFALTSATAVPVSLSMYLLGGAMWSLAVGAVLIMLSRAILTTLSFHLIVNGRSECPKWLWPLLILDPIDFDSTCELIDVLPI
ncbi:hypothetical protein SeMB42_g04421 [Synchytrium endobioticum]|uniref:Uncharacterized protein n=1 Tax=Synchytrium endobioticum TaxID=286115 RepID=A0A507CY75_9FUNG|nr:hypothetical protein SeMB42_g04421 [Synchytrium endobioticum]